MGVLSASSTVEHKRPYLRGVKVLVDGGMDIVPDIYIQPEHQRLCKSKVCPDTQDIPVIDLRELSNSGNRPKAIAAIGQACQKWGFFQVTNHGVPVATTEKMKEVAYEFFELPVEEKMAYHATSMSSKMTMYGTSFNPYEDKTFDWRDYLRHSCNPLSEENVSSWPANPPSYRQATHSTHTFLRFASLHFYKSSKAYSVSVCTSRETAVNYSEAVGSLCKSLLRALSESLGLSPEFLDAAFGTPNERFLLLNYYPPCPDPALALGLSSHSDVGGITILLQDATSGLQVLNDGQWIPVKPLPGAFVVNVGDQLQVLSNGKYKSVEHRVVLNSECPRLSIALFYNPSFNTVVSPVEELLDESHPPLYKEFTFSDYKKRFYAKLDGKACIRSVQTTVEASS
ncbi:protein DMR6-LIKE OXYGENASE 2 [Selaginella moellendorffii]|uniref:protein DMR6-LIKE OXYGENASE 2 n=1 Tax=Selaginella moellendorffii TaxID=88036 RepID=UPI000D1CADD6|nr:protein DMR6-LIKE OXYGENASE 2 [Selaginella moellendorffii]|eukprot:XP_024519071.1 protein DMR6-LIKE OXYGENASE 2 [Selaginella moellendorffii]